MEVSGTRRLRELEAENGRLKRLLAEALVMDNGPELTSKAMFGWAQRTGVEWTGVELLFYSQRTILKQPDRPSAPPRSSPTRSSIRSRRRVLSR